MYRSARAAANSCLLYKELSEGEIPSGLGVPRRGRIGGPGGGGLACGGALLEDTEPARSRALRAKWPPAGVDGSRPSGSQATGASAPSAAPPVIAVGRSRFDPVKVAPRR